MKKIERLIEEVSECLGIKSEETNERASRMVLLYNQSPNIKSTHQLRLRKAGPIKVLIALENAISSLGGGYQEEQNLLKQTQWYYMVLFSGAYSEYAFQSEASQDVKNYWNRLKMFGILEQKGNKFGLTSDYKQKYILMLSNTIDVHADNTYFKSMFTTLGCAVDTERYLWTKSPYEVSKEVGEILHNKELLAKLRNPDDIAYKHIFPLHERQKVNFYSTDSDKLGIPSVSPIKPSEVASYNPPMGPPIRASEEVLKTLNEIAENPFYSKDGLTIEYGRSTYDYIKNMNAINGSKSPLTIFTSANGYELIISKIKLDRMERLTRKALSTSKLKPEFEPIYQLAAELYYQIRLERDDKIVKNVISELIEDGKIKDDQIDRSERAVLEALAKPGGVKYNDVALTYDLKNERMIGILSGILDDNIGKISRYTKMTPIA